MKRWVVVGCIVALMVGLAGCRWPWQKREALRAYIVHHAEGAFEQLNRQFRRETGIRVEASYACRRVMYGSVSKNRDGDIYISSSPANLAKARDSGMGAGPVVAFAELLPVIVVDTGNPKNIKTLADLARPGVRVCLGTERCCIGRVTASILEKNKLTDKIAPNVVKRIRGEAEIAKSVRDTDIDATIVWLSTVRDVGSKRVDAIPIPAEQNVIEPLSFVVLNTGKNRAAAEQLGYFLQGDKAKETLVTRGLKRAKGNGF